MIKKFSHQKEDLSYCIFRCLHVGFWWGNNPILESPLPLGVSFTGKLMVFNKMKVISIITE